jgi:hypothetical protein
LEYQPGIQRTGHLRDRWPNPHLQFRKSRRQRNSISTRHERHFDGKLRGVRKHRDTQRREREFGAVVGDHHRTVPDTELDEDG